MRRMRGSYSNDPNPELRTGEPDDGPPAIETINDCAVALGTWPEHGPPELAGEDAIVMLNPPARGELLTRSRALRLAAWLVVIAEDATEGSRPRPSFEQILEAVKST